MTDPKYLQNEPVKILDHLAEECGEFIAAYSKMRRWGAESYNPELEYDERVRNIDWVMCEAGDVFDAALRLRNTMIDVEEMTKAFPLYGN
jgi:hypothetical protein